MPRLLTALQIAEKALERIGAFSVRDEGPDPDELDRALDRFDLRVQQLAGTNRLFWLVPTELTIPLTSGIGTYNLMTVLGSQYPPDGIQFPIEAKLVQPTPANRCPIEIARRAKYYGHSNLAQTGVPEMIYIDRSQPPTLYTYPVIALPDYSIKLSVQTFAPDLVTDKQGMAPHGLPAAWQRWGEFATAFDIGSGPVRRLPDNELALFKGEFTDAERQLKAYNNKEFAGSGVVAYRDF